MIQFMGTKDRLRFRKPVLSLGICLAGVIALSAAMSGASKTALSEQRARVEQAAWRSIMQCYVMEGQYPASISTLSEKYGLQVPDGYAVDYQYQGANILPEVAVLGGGETLR